MFPLIRPQSLASLASCYPASTDLCFVTAKDPHTCAACTQILRTFFALIFGTILFSMLIGLCFLPVVFSIVGPPRIGGSGIDLYAEDTLPVVALAAAARGKENGGRSDGDPLELVYGKGQQ